MPGRKFAAATAIALFALLAACSRQGMAPAELQKRRAPIPTMEEVALVDDLPLTVNGFVALRSRHPDASADDLYWMGTAALAAMKAGLPKGAAIDLTAYATGRRAEPPSDPAAKPHTESPDQARKALEEFLSRAVVRKNEFLFKSLASETSQKPAPVR